MPSNPKSIFDLSHLYDINYGVPRDAQPFNPNNLSPEQIADLALANIIPSEPISLARPFELPVSQPAAPIIPSPTRTPAAIPQQKQKTETPPIESQSPVSPDITELLKSFQPKEINDTGSIIGPDLGKLLASKQRPSPEDLELQQLENIQESRRQQLQNLAISETGTKIAEALSRRYGGEVPSSEKAFQQMRQQAELPIKDYLEKQGLIKERKKEKKEERAFETRQRASELELKSIEESMDPNSQMSKIYQALASKVPAFKTQDISQFSAHDLQKLGIKIPTDKEGGFTAWQNYLMSRNIELDKEKAKQFNERMGEKEKDNKRLQGLAYAKLSLDLTKDDQYKRLQKQSEAFKDVDKLTKLAESGTNQSAAGSIGTRMARAMGEVGVLTESDVARSMGSISWGRKVLSWFEKGMKGEIPAIQANEIRQVSNTLQQIANTNIKDRYNAYANRLLDYATLTGADMTPQEALHRVGAPGYIQDLYKVPKSPEGLSSEDQQALNWAQKNPNNPDAIEIIKRLTGK